MTGARRGRVVALAAAAAASAVFLATIRSYALVGWDTYPEIAASRVDSWGGLLAAFKEQTAAGYFPYGAFYRPLFNLSLALDLALWGLEPFGYLLTGVVLYGATAFATYVLAERLLGAAAFWGALAALAVFLLLPVQIEIVPIVSRRADMLCTLAIVVALTTQLARVDRPMPGGAVLPALWTAVAVAAKEPGLVMVPLAFFTVLLVTDAPAALRVRRAIAATAMHALAAGLVTAGRFSAIGGMGGHVMARPSGAIDRLPDMLGHAVLQLTMLDSVTAGSRVMVFGAAGLVALLGVAAAIGALLVPRTAEQPVMARVLSTVAIASVWLGASSAIFGVAGLLQPWYLFVQAPAIALLAGAAIEAAVAGLAGGGAVRLTAAGTLAVVLAWIGWQARYSPLLHRYGHLARASEVTTRYLNVLHERITHAAAGETIRLSPPPIEIPADPGQPVVHQAMVLRPYSIQAWADLAFGNGHVVVRKADEPADPVLDAQRVVVVLGFGSGVGRPS